MGRKFQDGMQYIYFVLRFIVPIAGLTPTVVTPLIIIVGVEEVKTACERGGRTKTLL